MNREGWVSEAIERIARIRAGRALRTVSDPREVEIEISLGGVTHRLALPVASSVAAALAAALDHVRVERPELLIHQPLARAEVDLVSKAIEWLKVLTAEGRSLDNITSATIERSMLLRRLRAGGRPLVQPPPTSDGQPWYDVLEADECRVHQVRTDGAVTTLAELLGTGDSSDSARNQFLVRINGCHWNVVRTLVPGSRYLVAFEGHRQLFELAGECPGAHCSWTLRKTRDGASSQ